MAADGLILLGWFDEDLIDAAAVSGASGSINWIEADDAAALTGSGQAISALAWTEANDTAALTGSVVTPATAALSWTEANDGASITGGELASAVVAWTEANDSAALTGAGIASASAAWTEADDIALLLGTIASSNAIGALAWVEDDDGASLTGRSEAVSPGAGHGKRRVALEYRKRIEYFDSEEEAQAWLESLQPVAVAEPVLRQPKASEPAFSAFVVEPVRYIEAPRALRSSVIRRNAVFNSRSAEELRAAINAHAATRAALKRMRDEEDEVLQLFALLD